MQRNYIFLFFNFQVRGKSGHLALAGRDGYFSIHSMEMNMKPGTENKIHFFHHDTGGVFRLDISHLGCILVVNQTG